MCRWFAPRWGGYRGAADRDGRQPPNGPSATSRGALPPPNLDLIDRSGAFRAQAEAVRRAFE